MQRELNLRKAMGEINRSVKALKQNEKGYIAKARLAKQIGADDQFQFLKATLRRTACQRLLRERQLLSIQTLKQIRDQVRSDEAFAEAMRIIAKSIARMFRGIDLAKTQMDLQMAMEKARTLEERMNLFLDATMDSLAEPAMEEAGAELVSDEEVDRMIEAGAAEEEAAGIDAEIASGLKEVEKELGKP